MSQPTTTNAINNTGITHIPFNQLHRSEANMRTIHPKKNPADKQLHQSIDAQGLLQNLVVVLRDDGDYEVPAGGRRFGSLELHVEQGCVFQSKPATDSTPKLPPIPRECCHLFQSKAAAPI